MESVTIAIDMTVKFMHERSLLTRRGCVPAVQRTVLSSLRLGHVLLSLLPIAQRSQTEGKNLQFFLKKDQRLLYRNHDVFRPLMFPSSGWQEQAYSNPADSHMSGRNMPVVTI